MNRWAGAGVSRVGQLVNFSYVGKQELAQLLQDAFNLDCTDNSYLAKYLSRRVQAEQRQQQQKQHRIQQQQLMQLEQHQEEQRLQQAKEPHNN